MSQTTDPSQAVVPARKNPLETREVTYIPFGAAEEVRLSFEIIKKYIASPAKNGELPGERDLMQFMLLCRNRALDPFSGDVFMLGYMDNSTEPSTVKWSLVTAHAHFLKRAEASSDYDGMESGVIVRDKDGNVIDRAGDFFFDDDRLLGGWAIVHRKSIKFPAIRRLKLQTFQKPYGQWKNNPNGMIVKCAEADALRSTFPSILGDLYTPEEHGAPAIEIDSENVTTGKTPIMGGRRSRVVSTGSPPPALPAPAAPPAAASTPPPRIPAQQQAPAANPVMESIPETPRAIANTGKEGRNLSPSPVATAAPAKSAEKPPGQAQGAPGDPKTQATDETPNGEAPASEAAPSDMAPAEFKANPNESDELQSVRFLMVQSKVSERQVMTFCRARSFAKDTQKSISDLSNAKLLMIAKGWSNFVGEIQATQV